MRSVTFSILAALLCGCGASPSSEDPPGSTPANLEGYWISIADQGAAVPPMMLHFEAELHPSELNPGFEHYAEILGGGSSATLATYSLEGSSLMFTEPSGQQRSAEIKRLGRDELVMRLDAGDRTFLRMPACAGPSLWTGFELGDVHDAAWDKFGGLHLMISNVFYSGYAWVAPGRCIATTADTRVRAATLDVTPEGDVRGLFFTRESGAGQILVTTIPAKPWERADLGATEQLLPAPSTPANAPPPMRSIDLPDGRFMVFYAYQDLSVITVDGAESSEVTVPLHQGSTLTPYRLDVDHLPDGAILVRGGRTRSGALHRGGTWNQWSAEGEARVFAYHDGTLYGAWADGANDRYNTRLVLGRRKPDGSWDTIAAGRGWPTHMHVNDDGSIEVVGVYERFEKAAYIWTHVPPGFAKSSWRQEYALGNPGGFFEQYLRSFGARFGPNGEVVMMWDQGVWRARASPPA